MLPGDFDPSADVRVLDTYALVEGRRREVETVDLDREFDNDLPDQVIGGAGVTGGSGTITWAPQHDLEVREASPWHQAAPWPPLPGTKVSVYVTDGITSWPRFTGRIDKTTGTVGGQLRSDIVDYRDQLNVPFTYRALLAHDVPLVSGGPYRMHDLNVWYLVTFALRRANLLNTIPAAGGVSLSVPMQHSMLAHRGDTVESYGTTAGTWPIFHAAPWGYSVGRVTARYEPHANSRSTMSQTLQISVMVGPDHAGIAHVRVIFGTNPDDKIRIRVGADRRVEAYWRDTLVTSLSATQMRDSTIASLLIKGNQWAIRNNLGAESTSTQSRSGTQRMSLIEVTGNDTSRIAGLVIDSPSVANEFSPTQFVPAATFEPSNMLRRMDMSPRLENRNLSDFMDEVCKATLTAAWFDESGVLRLVPSDNLRARNPVQVITSLDDITELEWETSLLNVRHRVNVEYQAASISRSRSARQELYRGGRNTMESGDTVEIFATPSSDEEWFAVDRAMARLDDSNWNWYNASNQSFSGVHYRNADGDELPTSGRTTTITVEPIGTVGVRVIHEAGTIGAGVEAHLAVSEDNPNMREVNKGAALPVVRGRGHGSWIDETYTSSVTADPLPDGTTAQELVHDLSYWGGQRTAERIGDFLAERITLIEPTIPRLKVTYDPRRQLGDVATISLGILDVSLRVLIVGISESHSQGEHFQHLKVRIIHATSARNITYQELADEWSGRDYNALQAVWVNLTYDDFPNHPIEGA